MSTEWQQLLRGVPGLGRNNPQPINNMPSQPQQQQNSNRQMPMQPPQNPGSASNPIEVVTPSLSGNMQLPMASNSNPNVPSFAQQPIPPPQRKPSFTGLSVSPTSQFVQNTSGQNVTGPSTTTPQSQSQSQSQSQAQINPSPMSATTGPGSNSANGARAKIWAGTDFSKEVFGMNEGSFMTYLKQVLKQPSLVPPVVQGKPVDLYALFNLVHRNGGSAKVSVAIFRWV